MSDFAWLGPVGELRRVPCPQPGVGVSRDRPVSFFAPLEGPLVPFFGNPAGGLSWDLRVTWRDSATVSWLSEVALGGVVGPFFLYLSSAARDNLLPFRVQSCAGFGGVVAGRRVVGAGDGLVTVRVPLRPDTDYTLSALGDGVGSVSFVLGGSPSVVGFGAGGFGAGGFGG